MWLKTKARSQKYKKARYAIGNASEKYIFKSTKEFEKIEKLLYEKKSPKHEPTECYFYLEKQLANCMIRSDTFNWHDYSSYTKMTAPFLNVYSKDEGKSKRSDVNEKLSKSYSTNERESKCIIVHETLS